MLKLRRRIICPRDRRHEAWTTGMAGGACVALFEGRGTVAATDDVVALTDPAPESHATVAAA